MSQNETLHTAPGTPRPESKKNKTRTRVIAGVAGTVVAAAAVTMAVDPASTLSAWDSKQQGPQGAIVAGDMSIDVGVDHGWYDASGIASNQPAMPINPASYALTPGDRLEKAQEITIKLTGDNISAQLLANIKHLDGDLASQGLSGTIRLVKGSYSPDSGVQPGADVITTTPIIDNPAAPQFTFTNAVTPADGKYTVLTDLVFDQASVLGQSAQGILNDTDFVLHQVRKEAPKPWVIPDPYLGYAISQQLGIPQEKLTTADALQLTSLDLGPNGGFFPNLASLEGLQYATNLTKLDISWTKVDSVAPLAGATKLTDFTANHASNLTSIDPLAGLKLVNFNTEWTQIDSVAALAAMDTLQRVDMFGDLALTDISALAGKPNLAYVSVGYAHSLNSIEALRFDNALTYVNAQQTGVTDWSPVNNVATVIQ
ncbi:hypothetical protein [Pseudarthrobacter phenanthrenivorans]|uniref:Alternate-type signal peptide domain-containing protein n=1 Tax=Pseudarthrobacter phenanthrenivorans TaxID=361575 RepID=A0A0B4DW74_PSEPS|nr:hypothetical protein [Pseudarthrobacter phenanthrenivorans]KIC68700.1 hypothetical protein RM50_04365 [Pseudarthrobacter phenanthrenivorans]